MAASELLEDRTLLSSISVTSTADAVDANLGDGTAADGLGRTTLRAAIMEANAQGGSHTIALGAGSYTLSLAGTGEDGAATGDLDIRSDITIVGAGLGQTTIDGNQLDRIFDIFREGKFRLVGVEVTGGLVVGSGTNTAGDRGGAMRIDFFTTVTIEDSLFRDNSAPRTAPGLIFGIGGAIESNGNLTILGSRFENNLASNAGGAIYVGGTGATTTIRNTTFAGNSAPRGGAIFNHNPLTVENCTFVGNGGAEVNGSNGGAINNNGGGVLTLTNSTITGNTSLFGGGLYVASSTSATITNSTIAGNTAGWGGGISGDVTLENSIVALNSAETIGPDIDGDVTSLGHNLIGNSTGATGFVATDLLNRAPLLAALADNGGSTWTRALLPGSPALDAANTATSPATDQRGIARPQGTAADIGAYELADSSPVASPLAVTIDEDTAVVRQQLTATDPDGDALTFAIAGDAANGRAFVAPDGRFSYFPNPNFFGTDEFTYTVTDPSGNSDTATVTVTVRPVNDPAYALNQTVAAVEDTAFSGQLAAVEVEGEPVTFAAASGPAHGTVAVNADGTFVYTPEADYHGADSFTFRATDDKGAFTIGTVTIEVTSVNDSPVANDDAYSVDEDGELVIEIAPVFRLHMDSEPGDLLGRGLTYDYTDADATFSASKNFDNGVGLSVIEPEFGGDWWYLDFAAPFSELLTPGEYRNAMRFPFQDPDRPGLDVSGNGSGWNRLTGEFTVYEAVWNADRTDILRFAARFEQRGEGFDAALVGTIQYNTTYGTNGGVLANDTDADGDFLSALLVEGPKHGTLTLGEDGSLVYTPNADFHGVDSFTYRASDGDLASDLATVTITVNPVGDAPVVAAPPATVVVDEDAPTAMIDLAGVFADTDGDLLAVSVSGNTNPGLVGADVANGKLVLNFAANASGTATLTLRGQDPSGAFAETTLLVTVNPVNDAPTAAADAYTVAEDGTLSMAVAGVLGNDADIEGDSLTAVLVSGPAHGTLTLNADGSFVYTPATDFHGIDSFTYRAGDGDLTSELATVTITVTPVNDVPVVAEPPAAVILDEDAPTKIIDLAGVFSDADADSLAVSVSGNTNQGLVSAAVESGKLVLRLVPDASGTATITLLGRDPSGASAETTLLVTVNPVNDAPVAAADTYTVAEDGTLSVLANGLLANDTDIEGDGLTAVLVSGPIHGTLTLNADGSFVYTPATDFHGGDSFTYRAFDGTDPSATVTVTIDVTAVNDAPALADAAFDLTEESPNGTVVGAVAGSDIDGDALRYEIVGGSGVFAIDPATGRISVIDGKALDFETTPTWTLTVRASDPDGLADEATVTVRLTDIDEMLRPAIDIAPGDPSNRVRLWGNGRINVAILSSETFDARTVVIDSLRFGRTGTEDSLFRDRRGRTRTALTDVNGDGRLDLIVRFDVYLAGFGYGDAEGVLTGRTTDGQVLEGRDSVAVEEPRGKGKKVARSGGADLDGVFTFSGADEEEAFWLAI